MFFFSFFFFFFEGCHDHVLNLLRGGECAAPEEVPRGTSHGEMHVIVGSKQLMMTAAQRERERVCVRVYVRAYTCVCVRYVHVSVYATGTID